MPAISNIDQKYKKKHPKSRTRAENQAITNNVYHYLENFGHDNKGVLQRTLRFKKVLEHLFISLFQLKLYKPLKSGHADWLMLLFLQGNLKISYIIMQIMFS